MTASRELEGLATLDHAIAAVVHVEGVVRSVALPASRAGAGILCHVYGLAHNVVRGNWTDVGAHLIGLYALASGSRVAHAIAGAYDATATGKHAARVTR